MTADRRAALVERVATLITRGCPVAHQCDGSGCHEWEAEQAIDIIRAEVLEEAAKECAYHWTPKECAAAIRALKGKP